MLWEDVRNGWAERMNRREHSFPALQDAIDDVFNQRIGDVSGRGKLAADMREIWVMQPRFEKARPPCARKHGGATAFRAGFDFMRLRADVGEVDEALADWWQQFSTADEAERYDLMEQVREEQKSRSRSAQPVVRRVPRAHRRPRGRLLEEGLDAPPGAENPSEGSAPKTPSPSPQARWRRRRRRQRIGGG